MRNTIFYISDLEGRTILRQVADKFFYNGEEGILTIYNDKAKFDSYVESVELISFDEYESIYEATINI